MKFLTAVATVGITAIGFGGFAWAQESPNKQGERPATERMEKRPPAANAQSEKREGETRTGQAAPNEKRDETRTSEAKPNEKRDTRTGEAKPNEKRDETRTGEAHAAPRVTGNLHVSQETTTRISKELIGTHTENVNITINVGVALPETVEFYPLPSDIVELAPEYQGYDYFVANDEIVFVQQSSRMVVGTIEVAADTANAGAVGQTVAVTRPKPCPVD